MKKNILKATKKLLSVFLFCMTLNLFIVPTTANAANNTSISKSYTKLKKYICRYGITNKDGNKFLRDQEDDYTFCIIYDSKKKCIDFFACSDGDSEMFLDLYVYPNEKKNVRCEFDYYYKDFTLSAYKTMKRKKFSTNIPFIVTENTYNLISESRIVSLANTFLKGSVSMWKDLLKPTKVSFKKLGFPKL